MEGGSCRREKGEKGAGGEVEGGQRGEGRTGGHIGQIVEVTEEAGQQAHNGKREDGGDWERKNEEQETKIK